jgi:hypothetical protein
MPASSHATAFAVEDARSWPQPGHSYDQREAFGQVIPRTGNLDGSPILDPEPMPASSWLGNCA